MGCVLYLLNTVYFGVFMSRKPSVRSKKSDNPNIVKSLLPKDLDAVSIGGEPDFTNQNLNVERAAKLSSALHWYGKYFSKKDAKEQFIVYLNQIGKVREAKIIAKVSDDEFAIPTYCWVARLTMRGLKLTENEQVGLEKEINRLVNLVENPVEQVASRTAGVKKVKEENNRPNVQEIMREKAREAAGELEGIMDDFNLTGSKANTTADAVGFLTKYNVLPQHTSIVTDAWKRKLKEYEEVLEGKDSQLVQAYGHLTKTQVKNTIKFIEAMLASINSYISNKKAAKAPRKRKAVPPEKVVAKLKYLKEFKDDSAKLNLTSVHPKVLLNASEAWVYDTAKRKLHHYVADDLAKVFSVKGNTLLGFDTAKSGIKTLRKPSEQLKEIMGSKPAARKYFKEIKAVATEPTGRFNADIIILKAF